MENCLFCNIIAKKISAEIIYEDDFTISFLDINPITPGHTLVIPKIHAENIIDLPENETKELFIAVKRITALLDKSLTANGFTIGINHGKASGQAIDHIHIHIIPRYNGDGGRSMHSIASFTSDQSLSTLKNIILTSLLDEINK